MKKLIASFTLCALCSVLCAPFGVHADDAVDTARSAKRGAANTIATTTVTARQRSETPTSTTTLATTSRSAATSTAQRGDAANNAVTSRTATPRDGAVISDQSRSAVSGHAVAPRSGTTVQPRAATTTPARTATSERVVNAARTAASPNTTSARSATTSAVTRPTSTTSRSATTTASRTGATRTTSRSATTGVNISRAATSGTTIGAAPSTDYKKCRQVFYDCMDEFCANKDTQLRRCACSSRINDFDRVKQNMSKVEDKMLSFNERLLTVNMDKEDALAISQATEGELAFQQKDTSDSKKILDEISKKLNSTGNDDLSRGLSSISLSLNTDTAWDNIDSLMGASTTTKEGTALYNAALPTCREMVREVCDEEASEIAESGYLMAIEQDCNTVAKAYETMQDQAMESVRESAALLDISRLNIHQERNSDDILTCKKKMLDMLTNSSVCGTDLGKCLDTTGRYIDPSTGEAFLTVNLVNLGTLITRPTSDQKWVDVSANNSFVIYLNSKKKYLEPAMENCQDIADSVWDAFMEDALAQIKLAQEHKLEDMRQSCTTLTTQCLTTTAKSISEFDARALSIFGVTADKTVNEMCAGVKTACTALLQTTGADADWVGGMTEIATDTTYDSIMQTCREVGKACIIQTCKSVSGNFGLCESVDNSVNRKSIINRSSCWKDVWECVQDAGNDSIGRIMSRLNKNPGQAGGDFYSEIYGSDYIRTNGSAICTPVSYNSAGEVIGTQNCVYDICAGCGTPGNPSCATCRLAEKIWGNCEFIQSQDLDSDPRAQNKIKMPESDETLLSWFATNTGTADSLESCRDTSCGSGFTPTLVNGVIQCQLASDLSSDKELCPVDKFDISTSPLWTNCCAAPLTKDDYGNCCTASQNVSGFNPGISTPYLNKRSASAWTCAPSSGTTIEFGLSFLGDGDYYQSGANILLCVGGTISHTEPDANGGWPNGRTFYCSGKWTVLSNTAGTYSSPNFNIGTVTQTPIFPSNNYKLPDNIKCVFDFQQKKWGRIDSGNWVPHEACNKIGGSNTGYPQVDPNNMFINY